MIYQIAGACIVITSIICGTWYAVTVRRDRERAHRRECKLRQERNDRIISNDAWTLYEEERQRRIAAETKCGIYQRQLDRAKAQMAKVMIGGSK